MTYMLDGRQYIALTIGGTPPELIALALPWAQPTVQGLDEIFTDDQVARGETLFVRSCVACHSNKLGEMSGHGSAPAVIGADFTYRWPYSAAADLYETMRQTMPEAAPNSLSAAEYADLTAYLIKLNDYTKGAAELEPDERERLRMIFQRTRRN